MASKKNMSGKPPRPQPRLLVAADNGEIYDHPDLLMLCRRGDELALPRPDDIMPLPPESELFLLPGRHALGMDPETGQVECMDEQAVAAFACPGHTLTGVAAYAPTEDAPTLPLFAYGAVGFAEDRMWVCAQRVDKDRRQVFANIPQERITAGARNLLKKYPDNRLIGHLARCALTYCCPAARNLALGRYECPLPTARACNARCVGCISLQPEDAGFPSNQQRIAFTPTVAEIVEVMNEHARREAKPIFSFGQGCEGEPLTEAALLAEAVALYRSGGGKGTVNVNTNASLPGTMEPLAKAGLNSIRASLNSARPSLYEAYYRPASYTFADVAETIRQAKANGLFVSLNLLYFPGVTDCEDEIEALGDLVGGNKVDFIQLRNLNLDPEMVLNLAEGAKALGGPSTGLTNFKKRLKKARPGLGFGYFNPYLG